MLVIKHVVAEKALSGCRRIALADHPFTHGKFGRLVWSFALGKQVDERKKRLREELKRVVEQNVPPSFDLELPLYVPADRFYCEIQVRGHFFDDQMPVLAAQIVNKHRHFLDDFSLSVAELMRGINVVAGHVLVLVDFSPVGVLAIY